MAGQDVRQLMPLTAASAYPRVTARAPSPPSSLQPFEINHMSSVPDHSNLSDAVSAATVDVATTATTAASGTATIALGDAFTAIAGYLDVEQSTEAFRVNVDYAAQKFNEFVAAINKLA